jgi:hypothetical protein
MHPDAAAAAAYSGTATPQSIAAAAESGLSTEAAAGVPAYSPTAAAVTSSAGVDAGGFKRGKWGKNDVLYGIINAIVGIPTMISFAAIVYQVREDTIDLQVICAASHSAAKDLSQPICMTWLSLLTAYTGFEPCRVVDDCHDMYQLIQSST